MSDPVETTEPEDLGVEEEEYDVPFEDEDEDDYLDDPYGDDDDDEEEEDDEEEGEGEETESEQEAKKEEEPSKTYKIKVRGEEIEATKEELAEIFGLKETPVTEELAEVLVDARQKQLAGMQALTEVGKTKKQIDMFFQELRSNPMSVLLDPSLGLDFDKLAEDRIIEKLQWEQMSPAERKSAELEDKLKRYEMDQQRSQQEQQRQQYEQETEHYANTYAQQAVSAIQSVGLPETEYVFQRVINHMSNQYRQTGQDPSAEQAIAQVQKEVQELASHLGKTMTPEQIAQVFGDDGRKKLREYEIKTVKSNRPPPRDAVPGNKPVGEKPKKKYLAKDEFRAMLDKRYGSL